MVLLKKFYDENKEKFNMSYESVLNYIKRGLVEEGIKIVNNAKKNSYYVIDKELFLSNFK